MRKIKKFNEFNKNEAVLPELDEIEVKPSITKPSIDVDNPIDIEGMEIGNETSELDVELAMEAKFQESIALKKGLKQKGSPDNHIS